MQCLQAIQKVVTICCRSTLLRSSWFILNCTVSVFHSAFLLFCTVHYLFFFVTIIAMQTPTLWASMSTESFRRRVKGAIPLCKVYEINDLAMLYDATLHFSARTKHAAMQGLHFLKSPTHFCKWYTTFGFYQLQYASVVWNCTSLYPTMTTSENGSRKTFFSIHHSFRLHLLTRFGKVGECTHTHKKEKENAVVFTTVCFTGVAEEQWRTAIFSLVSLGLMRLN